MINFFNSFPLELLYVIFFLPVISSLFLLGYISRKIFTKKFKAIKSAKFAILGSLTLLVFYVLFNSFLLQLKIVFVFGALIIISINYLTIRIIKDAEKKDEK